MQSGAACSWPMFIVLGKIKVQILAQGLIEVKLSLSTFIVLLVVGGGGEGREEDETQGDDDYKHPQRRNTATQRGTRPSIKQVKRTLRLLCM